MIFVQGEGICRKLLLRVQYTLHTQYQEYVTHKIALYISNLLIRIKLCTKYYAAQRK